MPWLVRYETKPRPGVRDLMLGRPLNMWRYREWMPILEGDEPVTLGEGCTPLLPLSILGSQLGMDRLWIKDESTNPTGSFKARGMSAAVTLAHAGGAKEFTVPTAGNAGVALSAYAARAGIGVNVWAPKSTPPRILEQMQVFGANLRTLDGHIGDCGREARAYAEEHGAFDVSTLREPYRIEGKKTLGLEIAEQMGWRTPDAIIYPTGGGTGLIGMWIAFRDLIDAGWVSGKPPRLYAVQSSGCAPVVKAFEEGNERTEVWQDPWTIAFGLRVPGPLGGFIVLRAIRETGGRAVSVTDEALDSAAQRIASTEGVDACPEGGATLAALEQLLEQDEISREECVVLFNTGAGWLYRG
jgi:threonine synthase